MDQNNLKKLINYLRNTPSGDNVQPWKFVFKNNKLEVHVLSELVEHPFDSGGTTVLISFGMMRSILKMVLPGMGYDFQCHFSGDYLRNPLFTIEFSKTSAKPEDPRLDLIFKRSTDRRLYQKESPETATHLKFQSVQSSNAEIRWRPSEDEKVLKYILDCECFFWQPKLAMPTLKWFRLTKKEYEDSMDGMYWSILGLNLFQSYLMRFFRKFPAVFSQILERGLFLPESKKLLQKQIQSSAGIWTVAVRQDRPEDILDAGELIYQFWLELTQMGYGMQPLTTATLTPYLTQEKGLLRDFVNIKVFAGGLEKLRELFGYSKDQKVIWGGRFGKVSDPKQNFSVRRKSVENLSVVVVKK